MFTLSSGLATIRLTVNQHCEVRIQKMHKLDVMSKTMTVLSLYNCFTICSSLNHLSTFP